MATDCTVPGQPNHYLGLAGGMYRLPMPDAGVKDSADDARVTVPLLNGGYAQQSVTRVRRTVELTVSGLLPDVADLIVAFRLRQLGPGPFRYVSPAWRNQLPHHISTVHAERHITTGFMPTTGAVSWPTFNWARPAGVVGCGVLQWNSLAGDVLRLGATSPTQAETSAAPLLTDQATSMGVWARTTSGSVSVTPGLSGHDAAGLYVASLTGTAATVTTTWQRLTFRAPAGSLSTSALVVPQLTAAAVSTLILSAPDLQYGLTATQTMPPWVTGLGVPAMLVDGPLTADHDVYWRRNHTLTLVEQ